MDQSSAATSFGVHLHPFYSDETMDQSSAATSFGVHLHPFYSDETMDQSSAATSFGVHLHPFLQCWNNGPKLSCLLFWCLLTPILQ